MIKYTVPLSFLFILALFSCYRRNIAGGPVTAGQIRSYIAVLAHDSLMGRKPFTEGETRTIYLSSEFRRIGLQPGNGNSYVQDVPMVEIAGSPSPVLQINGKAHLQLHNGSDFVAFSRQERRQVDLRDLPLVFAGYGVVAPEYRWNDYAGLDVRGKIVLVLVNDPGFHSGNPRLFRGDTMTYYGRWTYKYEEAARRGAAGVLIVHETAAASYPWQVVRASNSGSRLYLRQANKHMDRCEMEGWITEDAAKKLLTAAGIGGDIRAFARSPGFKGVELPLRASLRIRNRLKYSTSHNVIGLLPGARRPGEYIVYSAHWDHFGIGKPDARGDSIYNGAVDNADGTAALLGIAKAFAQRKQKPGRSIVFLAVTGEEQGLLGSEYYATHPLFPLSHTVADLNMDALGNYGPTRDLTITGKGQNDLEDYIVNYAHEGGLSVSGDHNPGSGSYFRSDHFNFAKAGVPALDMNTGMQSTEHPGDWAKKRQEDYTDQHYHQPSDNYSPDMDTRGMAQVANLLFRLGTDLAGEDVFPGWKKGSEFRAVREQSLRH